MNNQSQCTALTTLVKMVSQSQNEFIASVELGTLPKSPPLFLAYCDKRGNLARPANTVAELPHEVYQFVLGIAALRLGVPSIQYGVPISWTMGMNRAEVLNDSRPWISLRGADIPLSLFLSSGG